MREVAGTEGTKRIGAFEQFGRRGGRGVAGGICLEGADELIAAIKEIDRGDRSRCPLTLPGAGDDTKLIVGRLVVGQKLSLLFSTTDETHETTNGNDGRMDEMFHNFAFFVSKIDTVNSGGR